MTRLDPPVTLETERLVLRQPQADDWEPAVAFMTSPRAEFVGGSSDRFEMWAVFAHMVGHWVLRGYGMFVIEDRATGRAMGMAGPLYPVGWAEPEIGWSLWSGADEGRGYAREAALASRDHAYRSLGWKTAISYIDPRNTRSIRLAERLGATLDPAVAHPFGDNPCIVYRHPAPGAAA